NKFPTDTKAETDFIESWCESRNIEVALTDVFAKGGDGGIQLAEKIVEKADAPDRNFQFLYDLEESLESKIRKIAQSVYGADDIELSSKAKKQIMFYEQQGWGKLPVCMAKTQYSLSDD